MGAARERWDSRRLPREYHTGCAGFQRMASSSGREYKGGLHNPFLSFDWYFTKEQGNDTPSRRDGISENEEKENRKDTCGFIQEAGMKLKMPQYTIATAIVYFHRFFMRHSLKVYDKMMVGTACLFLAGKAEETPRKLKDAVSTGYSIKYPDRPPLKPESEDMVKRQESLVSVEREGLKATLFNMKVDHPYQELIKTVKQMKGQRELAQGAWNLVNDSLRTTVCLRFKPKMVAIAAIYLASKMINQHIELEAVPNLKVEELEEIGNEILDLYDSKNPAPIPGGGKPKVVPKPAPPAKTAPAKSAPAAPAASPAAKPAPPKPTPPPNPPTQAKPAPPPPASSDATSGERGTK